VASTATATVGFLSPRDLKRLFQDLGFQRLLAQKALKFADLFLLSPECRCRDNFFLGLGRRQSALLG
jgi:hypothetical protein